MSGTEQDELMNLNFTNDTKLFTCFIVFITLVIGGVVLLPTMVCRYLRESELSRTRLREVQSEAEQLEGLAAPVAESDDPPWSKFVAAMREERDEVRGGGGGGGSGASLDDDNDDTDIR